jgi:hypothetical protein
MSLQELFQYLPDRLEEDPEQKSADAPEKLLYEVKSALSGKKGLSASVEKTELEEEDLFTLYAERPLVNRFQLLSVERPRQGDFYPCSLVVGYLGDYPELMRLIEANSEKYQKWDYDARLRVADKASLEAALQKVLSSDVVKDSLKELSEA